MQINNSVSNVVPKSRFPWYISITLCIIVIASTVGIWAYRTFYIIPNIDHLQSEISAVEEKIRIASADKKVIIRQILTSNTIRPSLDINGLIREFQKVAVASNVRLKGFSVNNDTISTILIANEGDPQVHPDPASTIIKMMRDYARGQQYFALEPIYTIAGDSRERTTSIQFKIIGKKY